MSIDALTDEADLGEAYETGRHPLYVARTRARDCVWVSGLAPEPGFLRDLTPMRVSSKKEGSQRTI